MKNEFLCNLNQRERLHMFFMQYIDALPGAVATDGCFSMETMRQATALLLENKVFSNKSDMKMECLRDFEVIIPDELFLK